MRAAGARPRGGLATAGLLALLAAAVGCGGAPVARPEPLPVAVTPTLMPQTSGTTALLQAVSPVSERVVWVSGHRGTWARTTDGGVTWRTGSVPGGDSLQFRDVHAVSADTAFLMSAGPGELSRIYRTTDGGRNWTLQFTNTAETAFYDCFDFWDSARGVAFSDASLGRTMILRTEDAGAEWRLVPADSVPAPLEGEGSFAASGTCLTTSGDRHGWIGTGNSTAARVFRTDDAGATWTAVTTPLVTGEGAGITSIVFRDTLHGMALGGDLGQPEAYTDNVAVTADAGRTWALAGRPSFAGAVYGSSWVPGAPQPTLVAVGPKGASLTLDEGRTWMPLDTLSYWAVGFASPRAGWAVGPGGRITRIAVE